MHQVLCEAIAGRYVVQFHYAGGVRIVEPYRHGRSTAGNEVLRGYQIAGYSASRQPSGWKLFQVDKMADLHATRAIFPHNRRGYQTRDRSMVHIHCQV
jgi:hypothetical protein